MRQEPCAITAAALAAILLAGCTVTRNGPGAPPPPMSRNDAGAPAEVLHAAAILQQQRDLEMQRLSP
ncbi:hypothetical protein PTE30175_00448 [Pandoraea terrae]|uniref:Uncharacterized protein n=1 Tax=Pandoraea terrae TaxID=1537710 RepID=A0A5E4RZ32_9BURK|nr:hypothetical protein [Pandoraea terrae]VVD68537.1 hypothetical protein PTE30175_00448 [Pandoraea terrae]